MENYDFFFLMTLSLQNCTLQTCIVYFIFIFFSLMNNALIVYVKAQTCTLLHLLYYYALQNPKVYIIVS